MLAIGPLMIEHRLIERMLILLDKNIQDIGDVNKTDPAFIRQGISFLLRFADECHHGKEEDILFKALAEKNIAVKLQRILDELSEEHNTIRAILQRLDLAIEEVSHGNNSDYQDIVKEIKQITALYLAHIEKEDRQFFMPVLAYFKKSEQDVLLEQFAQYDSKLHFEHYRTFVEALEKSPQLALKGGTASAGDKDIYECSVCGYRYNPAVGDPEHGIKPGTPFSDLPDDWTCPICRASKDMFNRMESKSEVPGEDRKNVVKTYQNQDIIVHWYPQQCSHSGKCWGELPLAFKPQERPWVNLSANTAEEIMRAIDKCPSQALKYSIPEGSSVDPSLAKGPGSLDYKIDISQAVQIRVIKDGPLLLEGPARIFDTGGTLIKESDRHVLCRCGKTNNPPFCDGSHIHKE